MDEGILLPNGTVDTNKMNLISGTRTPYFVETLWTFTAGEPDTTTRIYDCLTRLYAVGRYTELYEFSAILHRVLGLKVPDHIPILSTPPEALKRYMFEFLLDYDDVIEDIAESGV